VDKLFPEIHCKGNLEKNEWIDLSKRVFGLTLTKISQVFRNSFDSIIISAFIGLVALAQYQNYYYIVNGLSILLAVFATAISAGLGDSIATESKEKNFDTYKELLFEYSSMAAVLAVCMLCTMQDFIVLWVGVDNRLPFYIVILCGIYFYAMRLGDVTAVYRQAAGLWWEDKYRPIVESVANLSLNIVLVKYWGIGGVLVSTIVSILFINIPWATAILFDKYFELPVTIAYKQMLLYLLEAVLAGGIAYFVCQQITLGSLWMSFIVKGLLAAGITIAILCLLNCKKAEFAKTRKRIRHICNK
jgi:O-antigen/teichoic acid export membrane protein